MWFGTFLDGPLAGSTFEITGGDGGGLGLGPLFAIGLVVSIALIVIVGPFIIWPIFIREITAGQSLLWGGVIVLPQVAYIACRVRSCVRHWRRHYVKELLLNMLFLFVTVLAMGLILGMIFIDPQTKALIAQYLPQLAGQFMGQLLLSLLLWIFALALLSAIPAAIICGVSTLLVKRIAAKAHVPY